MAQQIKKKFLAPEVIDYFDDQISAEESARIETNSSLQSLIESEVSTLEAADAAEESARIAGDASLQSQIDNIISNIDPAALDSLTEIVSAFQAADNDFNSAISSLTESNNSNLAAE